MLERYLRGKKKEESLKIQMTSLYLFSSPWYNNLYFERVCGNLNGLPRFFNVSFSVFLCYPKGQRFFVVMNDDRKQARPCH